ncbi:MAG: ABC transporter permease [Candidatus Helarchaeota archaeon]|nr:ABC transporter permease [Candidatus Helarchaeota archaeon]
MGWKSSLRHQIRIFKYSLLLAIRSMRHRSFRTFLTVIGILIGITTFTALMSIGVGMRAEIHAILKQFAGASMIVMSKISSTRPSIPGSVPNYLEQIPGINFTAGVIEDFASVNGESVMLTGVDPEKMEFILGLKTIEGMSLAEASEQEIPYACVIDTDLQEAHGLYVNETIIASSGITGTFLELYIVGIVESLGFGDMGFGGGMGGFCYTELTTMQEILVTTNVQVILVGLEDGADAEAVANAIKEVYPEAQVITEEEILAMMDQIVGIINGVLLALSAISLVVGALMIMSTMTMSVLERTREIGIMKSIGAKRTHVLTIFLTEAFLISLIAGLLGVLAAVGAIFGIGAIMSSSYGFSLPYSFEPWIFITSMCLAVVIGLASGAYPAWQAASVKPVEALQYG